jgi:ribosome biogenesis GTPase A
MHNCKGCGVTLQHTDTELEGFIPEAKYKNILLQNDKVRGLVYESQAPYVRMPSHEDTFRKRRELKQDLKLAKAKRKYEAELQLKQEKPVHIDVSNLEELIQLSEEPIPIDREKTYDKEKPLVCMRCFKLSKYGRGDQERLKHKLITKEPGKLLNILKDKIPSRSVIVLVVDLIDFEGSLISEVLEMAKTKRASLLLVANKCDILPKGYHYERVHAWVKQRIAGYISENKVSVISSRSGLGMKRVVDLLKGMTAERPEAEVYVLGCTNSGKSSFINKLLKMTWNLPEEKHRTVKLTDAVTASNLPGTTLDFVPVKCRSLDLEIFDTPGIPSESQITGFENLADPDALIPCKRITPVSINMLPGLSVWLGGLARIDMIEGLNKFFTVFGAPLLTVHRTPTDKADLVYANNAGKLLKPAFKDPELVNFVKERFEVNCQGFKQASKDVLIHGLGWVSITGSGSIVFDVISPFKVGITLRPPLMPFEAAADRLSKVPGRTINHHNWR